MSSNDYVKLQHLLLIPYDNKTKTFFWVCFFQLVPVYPFKEQGFFVVLVSVNVFVVTNWFCVCLQVRKASQEALLILLEQELVAQSDIENKVCPILLDLSAPDSDDEYKVEAVNVS